MPANGKHPLFRSVRIPVNKYGSPTSDKHAGKVEYRIVETNEGKFQVQARHAGGATSARTFDTRVEAEGHVQGLKARK